MHFSLQHAHDVVYFGKYHICIYSQECDTKTKCGNAKTKLTYVYDK